MTENRPGLKRVETLSEQQRRLNNEAGHVIRYVVTHAGKHGTRTLASAAQGRYTYATAEEAQRIIDATLANNSPATLESVGYVLPLEVRPCKCWPGHFDPKGIYFPDNEESST